MDFDTQNSLVEVGIHQDEDELYLKRLSFYATIRPADLRRDSLVGSPTRSIKELLSLWGPYRETEDVVKEATEIAKPERLELRDHELSVKGFHVDSRIVPGYRYSVRYLGGNEYLFDGEAKRLESIGLGYGRRLTFKGETLNNNENYFWSDSAPEGFAFSIEAIKETDRFTITDAASQPVGVAEVEKVHFPQKEKDTIIKNKCVVKHVHVRFACSVKSFNRDHGFININLQDFEVVEGVAEVVKERGAKEAYVRCIKNVYFQKFGACQLHQEL